VDAASDGHAARDRRHRQSLLDRRSGGRCAGCGRRMGRASARRPALSPPGGRPSRRIRAPCRR
jgi:hypothetical protein